jgi:hypothetical protein
MLTLIWTFNLTAIVLTQRSGLLRQVVVNSWNLLLVLAAIEVIWSLWAISTGQAMAVVVAAGWLGLNLVVTLREASRHARELSSGQIVLLCSWWIALLAMLVHAVAITGLGGLAGRLAS